MSGRAGGGSNSSPAQPSPPPDQNNRALGDTLQFLPKPQKALPRRAVRRQTVAARGAPRFVLVPTFGPFGLAYVQVPVLPPPIVRVPVLPLYAYRPLVVYRPVFAYPPPFLPAYPYGPPVY